MSPALVVAFATPLFGFSLQLAPMAPLAPAGALPNTPAVMQAAADASSTSDTQDVQAAIAADDGDAATGEPEAAAAGGVADLAAYAEQIRERRTLGDVHRAFGIATWSSMLLTVGFGFIQYFNLYGFFGSLADTPCVQGNAVFGQDQCYGEPWLHLAGAGLTTALYATTFALSLAMPDPNQAAEGNGDFANNLRIHKVLRWVHLGGMIAQMIFGFVVSRSGEWFGIDRANDFEAMQVMATVHQGIGLVTFGSLSAAAALMIF